MGNPKEMKYVAAYTLLTLGGNENVSDFLKKIDCEVDENQLKACVNALSGKKLYELCQQGMEKLSSFNVGSNNNNNNNNNNQEKEPTVEEESEDMDMGDLFV